MRVGVIDLGTNTFNLLVADVSETSFQVMHTEKDGVALGMGGINVGAIADDAIERALHTLNHFVRTCHMLRTDRIVAFGTSALRAAKNRNAFVKLVHAETGVDVQIISGLQEAEMIYKGVQWSYDFHEPGVIMDIGGGSTEFIWADAAGMNEAISLEIGVSRMYQALELNDPFTPNDIRKVEQWLDVHAKGGLDGKEAKLLIGASGTFETFYELHHKSKYPDPIRAVHMDLLQLNTVLDAVIHSTMEERKRNPFIIPIRQKMAPIAAVKIKWVMRKLGIESCVISPCSLKEGAIRMEVDKIS